VDGGLYTNETNIAAIFSVVLKSANRNKMLKAMA
jgi:hypothetical protein